MGSNAKFPPESYTPTEQQRMDELRNKLSDLNLSEELLHPAELIRWLRARNLNVEKANDMIRKHLEWRRLNNADGILEREQLPEEFRWMMSMAHAGVDKEGYPIVLAPAGRRDMRVILEKYGIEKCNRFNVVFCEMVMDFLQTVSREQGRPVKQMVQIIDLEGMNFGQFASKACLDMMGKSQTTFNENYPEILKYAMVINAPKAFHVIWNLFKPFIPKETLEKMEIFGTDKDKWMKAIADKFPLDGIPPHWGGKKKGTDEYCSDDEEMWMLGAVSKSFFNYSKPYPTGEDNEDSSNLITKTIGARDSLKIRLSVTTPNSSIAWRFRTENHDICFQILDEDENEVVPQRKVKCGKELEEGEQQCPTTGIYTVVFDNSYSWARSKTISYNVSLIEGKMG